MMRGGSGIRLSWGLVVDVRERRDAKIYFGQGINGIRS